MKCRVRWWCIALGAMLVLPGLPRAGRAGAQSTRETAQGARGREAGRMVTHPRLPATDSVILRAGPQFSAGPVYRYLLGDNYRDLWTAPIRVPLLDIRQYAGGLTPLHEGGSAQTRNLHLRGADGREYVFRPVHKGVFKLPDEFDGTVVADVVDDGLSAMHPAATVLATPFLQAAHVLHPSPVLVVMPDDERLGKFRAHFAGILGSIEQFPEDPDDGKGFGGAVDIIDSDDLLERIDRDPKERIDAHALLTDRLIDMLIGDNDRHPGQWKWARFQDRDGARWMPIPRDRDMAFVSYEGLLLTLARRAVPRLVNFGHVKPSALGANAFEFDRRLLAGLDEAAFDSTARFLMRVESDSVIGAAIDAMPAAFRAREPHLADRIRARRQALPDVARRWYGALFRTADVHATEAADRASIVRNRDGSVDVRLRSGETEYLVRRFTPDVTEEIHVYLHAGDDTAFVTGSAPRSIVVRIIAGSGDDVLVDSSVVHGRTHPTHFYDVGVGGEAVADLKDDDADRVVAKRLGYDPDTAWNWRPPVRENGALVPPFPEAGGATHPIFGLKTGSTIGIEPSIGFSRRNYGFRQYPYASRVTVQFAWSTGLRGIEAEVTTDNRLESSERHYLTDARMSQLQTGRFRGYGNDAAPSSRFDPGVRQTQWEFRPAIGWAFHPSSDLSLGPVVRYTATDSVAGQFIAHERPYGFPRSAEAGLELQLHHEITRRPPEPGDDDLHRILAGAPRQALAVDLSADFYPAVLDVTRPYGSVSAVATSLIPLPLPLTPILALRAGARDVFGQYPYYDAAFLGGRETLRTLDRQQYAGDAAVYGTVELRVPVAHFPLIVPMNAGLLGFVDAGRVYVDGKTPGGWHEGAGGGFWLGVLKSSTNVNVLFTDQPGRRVLVGAGFVF